jgi:hypothetical protein
MRTLAWTSWTLAAPLIHALSFDWSNIAYFGRNDELAHPAPALHARDHNANGSQFLWLEEDMYAGKTFFECVRPSASLGLTLTNSQ